MLPPHTQRYYFLCGPQQGTVRDGATIVTQESVNPVDWVERVQNGDRSAEEAIVVYFRPRVTAFTRVRMRDQQTVEEIVQDVLWAAIKSIRESRLEQPSQLANFILSIARHRITDVHRQAFRNRFDPWPEDFDPPQLPNDTAVNEERSAAAKDAIDSLEPADRAILNMVLVEGMKPSAIAERLGLTSEVVRQRKSRALKKVYEIVQSQSSDVQRLPTRRPPAE